MVYTHPKEGYRRGKKSERKRENSTKIQNSKKPLRILRFSAQDGDG
jgi:hypothetical protein